MDMESRESHSQESTTDPKEPIQEALRNFLDAVDSQYSKRNNLASLQWSDIHMLSTTLLSMRNVQIRKYEQKYFINHVMDYIELVLCFVSNFQISGFKKQIKYVHILLNFIPDFFEPEIANTFIRRATTKVFDLFLHGSFSNISKKELLHVFNRIASRSSKEVRVNTAEREMFYMYKLVDSLFTYGDYAIQADILETIFRLFGTYFRSNQIHYALLPGCLELGKALLTEISITTFDADVRSWLNKFNQDSKSMFSITFQSIMFGNTPCKCPDEGQGKRWLDFNFIDPMVSFFIEDEHNDHWNRAVILPRNAKRVEIKRNFSTNGSTTTLFLQMSKGCLSYSLNAQKYLDTLDRNLKIVIINEEKDKLTKLISSVLPRLFGDSFVHTSARISGRIKKVYKPLGVKVSRVKSTTSTSSSKSKNQEISSPINAFKYSVSKCLENELKLRNDVSVVSFKALPTSSPLLFHEAKRDAIAVPKYSKTGILSNNVLLDNVSCVITDFTACSSRDSVNSDLFSMDSDVEIVPEHTNSSEFFDIQAAEELQHNIVTSSHKCDDLSIPVMRDFYSGSRRKSSSTLLNEHDLQFESSSSPEQKSIQLMQEPNEEDIFHSISGEDEFETARDYSESFVAMKTSHFKDLERGCAQIMEANEGMKRSQFKDLLIDNASISDTKEVGKKSQFILEFSNECVKTEQLHLNKRSANILDRPNSVENTTQNTVIIQNNQVDSNELQEILSIKSHKNDVDSTQDLFNDATQAIIMSPAARVEENQSDNDTESIFNRTTQEFKAENQESHNNFTELSMDVNIGAPVEELSEEIFKPSESKVGPLYSSKTIIEDGVEMIFIDLTVDDGNTNEVEPSLNRQGDLDSKCDFQSKAPIFNTPELICALTRDNSQSFEHKKNAEMTQGKRKNEAKCFTNWKKSQLKHIHSAIALKDVGVDERESCGNVLLDKEKGNSKPDLGVEEQNVKKSKSQTNKETTLERNSGEETFQESDLLQQSHNYQQVPDKICEIPIGSVGKTSVFVDKVVEQEPALPKLKPVERPRVKKVKSKGSKLTNKKKAAIYKKVLKRKLEITSGTEDLIPNITETPCDTSLPLSPLAVPSKKDQVEEQHPQNEHPTLQRETEQNSEKDTADLSSLKTIVLLEKVTTDANLVQNLEGIEEQIVPAERSDGSSQKCLQKFPSQPHLEVTSEVVDLLLEGTDTKHDIIPQISSSPKPITAGFSDKVMAAVDSNPNLEVIKEQKVKKVKSKGRRKANRTEIPPKQNVEDNGDLVLETKTTHLPIPPDENAASTEQAIDIDSKANSESNKENMKNATQNESIAHVNEETYRETHSETHSGRLCTVQELGKVSDEMSDVPLIPKPVLLEKVMELENSSVKMEVRPKRVRKITQILSSEICKKKLKTSCDSEDASKLDLCEGHEKQPAIICPNMGEIDSTKALAEKDMKNDNLVEIAKVNKSKRTKKTKPTPLVNDNSVTENVCSKVTITEVANSIKGPECNSEKDVLADDIENSAVLIGNDNPTVNINEANEEMIMKVTDAKCTENETPWKKVDSEMSIIAEIDTVEDATSNCDVMQTAVKIPEDNVKVALKRNAPLINVLEVLTIKVNQPLKNTSLISMDTVVSQITPHINSEVREEQVENLLEDNLENNTVAVKNDKFQTSAVSVVEVLVHASADGTRQVKTVNKHVQQPVCELNTATTPKKTDVSLIETLPSLEIKSIAEPKSLLDTQKLTKSIADDKSGLAKNLVSATSNKKQEKSKTNSNKAANPGRKLYKPGSYSYLDHLNMDTSSDVDSTALTPLKKKRKYENSTFLKKQQKKNTTEKRIRKRNRKSKDDSGFGTSGYQNLTALFNQSCSKHLKSSRVYEKRFESSKLGGNNYASLDIVTRCAPRSSSSDEPCISVGNKLENSSPELNLSSSEHFSWPEIETEPSDRKKINILQNVTIKRKSKENCTTQSPKKIRLEVEEGAVALPTFADIDAVPSINRSQNLEILEQIKDTGLALIKQIVDLIETDHVNSIRKLKILRNATSNFEGK